MGADMVTMTLALPSRREPDWDAAARAIRDLRLEVVWDAGDLYPWEWWLQDTENLPGGEAAFVALRAAQSELRECAAEVRGALEHGWPEELIAFETPTHRVYVSGGPSWGGDPGDLMSPLICLAEAGITDAAGFEGYTRYAWVPIEERTLGFDAEGLRITRFGVAAAHAAEQAAGMVHPGADASAWEWFDRWLAELEGAPSDEAGGRALLRFAARGLALRAWLKEPATEASAACLDELARDLARLADEAGLDNRPRRRSWRSARADVRRLANDLRRWFAALDDPTLREDDDVRWFIENAGGTLGDALEIEVTAHPLFAAVAALADLHGDDVGALVEAVPAPIESVPPAPSERRFAPLAQYLSLALIGEVDWRRAERAVEELSPDLRDERRADLAELRRLVTVSEYRRFATSDPVAQEVLFIAAPRFADVADVAVSIGRLGRDGVLDAAGVSWWSAPDPDFEGPVESYVPGYGPTRRG
jgi:hypothetical protein